MLSTTKAHFSSKLKWASCSFLTVYFLLTSSVRLPVLFALIDYMRNVPYAEIICFLESAYLCKSSVVGHFNCCVAYVFQPCSSFVIHFISSCYLLNMFLSACPPALLKRGRSHGSCSNYERAVIVKSIPASSGTVPEESQMAPPESTEYRELFFRSSMFYCQLSSSSPPFR